MANLVRDSFLRWIHHEFEHERLENYVVWDSYYNGSQDVDIPAKVKAALESELGTRVNLTRVVVDTPVDYIMGEPFSLEVTGNDEAERALYEIYRKNQLLDEEMLKLITIMGKKGDAFLKLYIEDDEIHIRVLRPEIVFPRYADDDYRKMLYCAIKWWEADETGEKTDTDKKVWHAQVFREDVIEYWELEESDDTQSSQWEFKRSEDNVFGFIPIIHVKNTVDDLEFGVSDIQVMVDLQDAMNKTITDMLLTMDNQAFQRLFAFGVQTPRGHEISMEPGIITEVPTPEGHVDVIPAVEISQFVRVLKELRDFIFTITSTSKLPVVEPEVSHPASGFALKVRTIPLERKCGKKKIILQNRIAELNEMIFQAMKILGQPDYTGSVTRIHFGVGIPEDDSAMSQVYDIRLKNKTISRRTVMEKTRVEDVELEMKWIKEETDEDWKTANDAEMEKATKLAEADAIKATKLAELEAAQAKEIAQIEADQAKEAAQLDAEKAKELAEIAAEQQTRMTEAQMKQEAKIEVQKARELAELQAEVAEKQMKLDIEKAKALAEIELEGQLKLAKQQAKAELDAQLQLAEQEMKQQVEMTRQVPATPLTEEPAGPVEEEG